MSNFNQTPYFIKKDGVIDKEKPKYERKKPVPFPVNIEDIIPLAERYHTPYDILFKVLYYYGLRIGEGLELKAKDFKTREHEGAEYLIVRTRTEKNRRQPFRELASPIKYGEGGISNHVLTYLDGLNHEEKLFSDVPSRNRAANVFRTQKIDLDAIDYKSRNIIHLPGFRLHPHYLRHCRLTHLVTEYDYNVVQLTQFAGWTDFKPATIYLQLNWRNLLR